MLGLEAAEASFRDRCRIGTGAYCDIRTCWSELVIFVVRNAAYTTYTHPLDCNLSKDFHLGLLGLLL